MAEQFDLEKEISEIQDPKALRVIAYLLKRIQVLEEKIARLEKDSSTSSKPPSSDITKPADQQRRPGERKIGAQPHHRAKNRVMFSPEELDDSKVLDVKECPDCGSKLTIKADADVLIQQSVELPEKPIQIIEYQRPGCWCAECKKLHYAQLPSGMIEGQLCGPRLQSLIAYLKGGMGASYTELSRFCSDVLGFKASRGMLCDIIRRVTQALEKPCQELEAQISKENVLNIDESGWYDSGGQYWIWLFCTSLIAFFSIQSSRGCKVLREIRLFTKIGG